MEVALAFSTEVSEVRGNVATTSSRQMANCNSRKMDHIRPFVRRDNGGTLLDLRQCGSQGSFKKVCSGLQYAVGKAKMREQSE